jgi:hypothetical protein
MKITHLLLLAVALFLAQAPLQAQHRTADSIVHKLFASLQQKDEKAYLALFPNQDQFSRFVKTIMEQVMKSDAMKQIFAMDEKTKNMNIDSLIMAETANAAGPKEYEVMQARFKSTFQKTIEKGEAKGVKWSEARLTGFTVDSTSVSNKEAQQFNLGELKEAKGIIDFAVADANYQLAFGKMMFFPGESGWFGAEIVQLARKGESLAPDASGSANEMAAVDSLDSIAVAPEPRPVKPSKRKPATIKGKSNATKSPARKPKS